MYRPSIVAVAGELLQEIPILEESSIQRFFRAHSNRSSNGSKGWGDYCLLSNLEFAAYRDKHPWAGGLLQAFIESAPQIDWPEAINPIPPHYRRPISGRTYFREVLELARLLRSIEGLTGVKLRIPQGGAIEIHLYDFLPPDRNWVRFRSLEKDSDLYVLVRSRYATVYRQWVTTTASALRQNFPQHVELDDLVNDGVIGLIEALDNFDPAEEVKFETFAFPRVRGAMLDDLRRLDWVPRSVRSKSREKKGAIHRFGNRMGREPSFIELAGEMDVSFADLNEFLRDEAQAVLLSLDELVYREEDNRQVPRVETVAGNNSDPIYPITRAETLEAIKKAIRELLPPHDFLIVWLYYIEEMTLDEIGEMLGISESRVSQIHTNAIFRLQAIFHDTERWTLE